MPRVADLWARPKTLVGTTAKAGGEPLGSEVACQSAGAGARVFVVRSKP